MTIRHALRPTLLALLSTFALAACGPSTVDADVTTNDTSDADATVADGDDTPTPIDGETLPEMCPDSATAAQANGTACTTEGQVCRYGYDVPFCGGRTLRCTSLQWSEEHTDPSSECFQDGGAAVQCGSATCAPGQFCVHQCSGVDAGADAPQNPGVCGAPSDCHGDAGFPSGGDFYCGGCA